MRYHPECRTVDQDESSGVKLLARETTGRGHRPVRVTAWQVARHAKVSQSAVSRAFAGGTGVSNETRTRIFAVAKELGYQPNALARGLITQRSRIVGIVISDFGNLFLTTAVERLSKRLGKYGLQPLLIAADTEEDISAALPTLEQYRVEGCFVVSPHIPKNLAGRYQGLGTTVLMFNPKMVGLEASCVSVDNVAAGRAVADLFLAEGHHSMGYIHGPLGAGTDRDRFVGFSARLEECSKPAPLVGWGNYSYNAGARAFEELVSQTPPPTAIFCASDIMAMGALDVARHALQLKVPEQIAIVGFDDSPPAAWPSYDLTTIRQPIDAMVDAGIDILLAADTGRESKPVQRVLPSELVIRGSTRTQPSTD